MASSPLIHIGYHKTATTWLQRQLFNNSDANFQRFFSKDDIRDYIIRPNSLYFDDHKVKDYYNSLVPDDSIKVSVVSSERLSGHPHSGGYDSKEIADRLYKIFPNGKILIVIREPKNAIASCYLQYIKFGGTCSVKDYLTPPQIGSSIVPLFNFDHFNYIKLIEYYLKLFNKENVLVLPYELFKKSPNDFCSQIINFAGANKLEELPYEEITHKRLSTFGSSLARHFNKVFAKTTLNPSAIDLAGSQKYFMKAFIQLDSLIPKATHSKFDANLKDIIEEKIGDKYKESNKRLSEILGLDLTSYGYEV